MKLLFLFLKWTFLGFLFALVLFSGLGSLITKVFADGIGQGTPPAVMQIQIQHQYEQALDNALTTQSMLSDQTATQYLDAPDADVTAPENAKWINKDGTYNVEGNLKYNEERVYRCIHEHICK